MSANGTSCARGGSSLNLTYGLGTSTASRLVRLACIVISERDLLTGGHEQWRLVGLRVEDRADAVADPGRRVQVDVGDHAAGLRVAVGHPDGDGLLQAEHVAEVVRERPEHRQLGRPGVAEHRRHPALAEQLERRRRGRCSSLRSPHGHRAQGYTRREGDEHRAEPRRLSLRRLGQARDGSGSPSARFRPLPLAPARLRFRFAADCVRSVNDGARVTAHREVLGDRVPGHRHAT